MARSEALNRVSTALVVLNLVLMCMPYADQPEEYERAIDQAEKVISLLFIVEMALKLLGLGCSGYWSDKWNKLDGTIVLLTSVDLVLSATGTKVGVNVSFFRILRVARMFRLMRAWPALYQVPRPTILTGSAFEPRANGPNPALARDDFSRSRWLLCVQGLVPSDAWFHLLSPGARGGSRCVRRYRSHPP